MILILSSINSSFTSSILHLIQKFNVIFIRPLSKLAYAEGFEGDAERRTAAYSDVREDSSTASTYKSPAEVEFQKRSIEESENGQKSKEIDQKGALDILYPAPKQDDIKGSRNDIEGSGNDIEDWVPNLFLINKITKNTKQNYLVNFPLIVNDHLEYGKIFHKILEDATKINDFSSMNKHLFIHKLPTTLQEKIHSNIDKLLNNIEFMALISQELKTEVTIGTTINDEVKIGRIDLLAIDTGKITIIDYKSDASPPKTCQLVKESYIDQLNFYRHIIAKLYPNNEIICKILWLENANFMTIG